MADIIEINKKPQQVEDIIDDLVSQTEKIEDLYVVVFIDGHLHLRGTGNWARTCMASTALSYYAEQSIEQTT